MSPEILAIFIPIIFLIGLFTAISLHIYFKYKARVATAEHTQGESVDAWCRAEAMARASVSRSAALRLGGFLTGAGIGTALGVFIGGMHSVWTFFGSVWESENSWSHDEGQLSLYLFFIMACAMLLGGLGMIGVYFLERALEGKKHKSNN